MPLWGRKSAAKAHWSKDYVEHLRTVHFALIAISVAAILISGAPDTYRIRTAQRQLKTIQDLVGKRASLWHTKMPGAFEKSLLYHGKAQIVEIPDWVHIVEGNCKENYSFMQSTERKSSLTTYSKAFSNIEYLEV